MGTPHRLTISGDLKSTGNELIIEVANSWENRLQGDQSERDRNVRKLKWDSGLLGGQEFRAGRYTFTTLSQLHGGKLRPSGLLGPVRLLIEDDPQSPIE